MENVFEILPPVDTTVELTEIELVGIKLHPLYGSKFNSIFGKVYSIKNLLSVLSTTDDYFKYINTKLSPANIYKLSRAKKMHRNNYWEIVELNFVDRLFKDRALLEYLIVHYDDIFLNRTPVVYNIIKRGIKRIKVADNVTPSYIWLITDILDTVNTVLVETNLEIYTTDSLQYTILKNNVKTKVFENIVNRINNKNILDDIPNDKLLEEYIV